MTIAALSSTPHPMLDPPVRALAAVPAAEFARIRQRLLLDCCKWDPQVGDMGTLAEFPLLLAPETWHRLASWAEALTAEALDAEEALLRAPHLYGRLALPPAPGAWIAQRRFHSIPLATPRGPLHSCVGIYTVNGRASGICGRLSAGPVVDYRAIDAAVLVGTGDSDERTVERRMEG